MSDPFYRVSTTQGKPRKRHLSDKINEDVEDSENFFIIFGTLGKFRELIVIYLNTFLFVLTFKKH